MTSFRLRSYARNHAGPVRGLLPVTAGCLVASMLLGGATPLRAGSGGIISLPMSGTKIKSGLQIQVDTRWIDGNGYRPVRVRISPIPPGPAPADRSIEVKLRPRSWQTGGKGTAVTRTVELSQGARFGEATIAIPQYEMWNNFDIETREDGDVLRDLSVNGIGFPIRSYYNWSEVTPGIVVLDKDAPPNVISSNQRSTNSTVDALPDIRALASRIPLINYSGISAEDFFNASKSVDDADILRLLNDIPRMDILPPEDLPDRWIELTCIDIIVVSFAELERIVREMPSTWQAIRDWQACGNVLCVFGMGPEYQHLADLERHLDAAPLRPDDRQPHLRGWAEPKGNRYAEDVPALAPLGTYANSYSPAAVMSAQGTTAPRKNGNPPDPQLFVLRNVRQGEVVAMRVDDPFPGTPSDWAWLLNSLAPDGWMWYRRHGMSMHRENNDYWGLLIPGVGEAPVNSFLVLITLFVVMIGPVNYFVLQRQRRLFLILVTVPLGAVVVTGCLLIYALLTDGLGVRMRTRSVTEIDQPSGQVVTWSRQSYYAGLAPSGGLLFPEDAAVYPVAHRPNGIGGRGDRNQHLIWDGQQRLASGFLTTRSTKQFLVVESRKTTAGLTVEESAERPRVTNSLGSGIDELIVRTSTGELFAGRRIGSGETAVLSPVAGADASEQWTTLLANNRPRYPVGFDPRQVENAADFFGNYNYYSRNVNQGFPDPTFKTSIFERRLRDLISVRFSGLSPRSYLAAVEGRVEVSVGLEDAREEAGFHLVMGRW